MDQYEKGPILGEGTFGKVFKATQKETNEVVAIKIIRANAELDGVNMTSLREIKLQRELKHNRIVKLLDVFEYTFDIALVFEYMDSDLEAVIRDKTINLIESDIKSYMKMGLEALDYIHDKGIFHRDIKPNNFLISNTGEIKLGDFGLARLYSVPDSRFTPQVFSRWYRPPELLYGSTLYSPKVDIWAMGCIFAELILRKPWFPGESDIEQLSKIFSVLGTPSETNWPDHQYLNSFIEFYKKDPIDLKTIFPKISNDAIDLLSRMVKLDPNERLSAKEALNHFYFKNLPLPTIPSNLPRPRKREDAPLLLHKI